jgi:hypothetical protein
MKGSLPLTTKKQRIPHRRQSSWFYSEWRAIRAFALIRPLPASLAVRFFRIAGLSKGMSTYTFGKAVKAARVSH